MLRLDEPLETPNSIVSWLDEALDRLAKQPCCGYQVDTAAAVEPTALAAMALLAGRRAGPATRALGWLADVQSSDGSLGIDAARTQPCWPTGWAVLAWQTALAEDHGLSTPPSAKKRMQPAQHARWAAAAAEAIDWILSAQGKRRPRVPIYGHNPSLQGWPWVESTHAWVEPTAISVMALKASGQADDPRCRQGVELLLDRMLPSGGWNYGNTVVLGSTLRPHLQPTGLALAALVSENNAAEHVGRSIDYLHRKLGGRTTTASLCYALIGATAHQRRPEAADRWLQAACRRTLVRDASPYKLALLVLAASAERCGWSASTAKRSS